MAAKGTYAYNNVQWKVISASCNGQRLWGGVKGSCVSKGVYGTMAWLKDDRECYHMVSSAWSTTSLTFADQLQR
jgi:hypothetical protein